MLSGRLGPCVESGDAVGDGRTLSPVIRGCIGIIILPACGSLGRGGDALCSTIITLTGGPSGDTFRATYGT